MDLGIPGLVSFGRINKFDLLLRARLCVARGETTIVWQELSLTRLLMAGQSCDGAEAMLAKSYETLGRLRAHLGAMEALCKPSTSAEQE